MTHNLHFIYRCFFPVHRKKLIKFKNESYRPTQTRELQRQSCNTSRRSMQRRYVRRNSPPLRSRRRLDFYQARQPVADTVRAPEQTQRTAVAVDTLVRVLSTDSSLAEGDVPERGHPLSSWGRTAQPNASLELFPGGLNKLAVHRIPWLAPAVVARRRVRLNNWRRRYYGLR